MKIIRNTLLILASLVVIVGMLYRYTTTTFLDLSDYDHLYVTPAQNIPSDGVTVQFAGVSTMLISDQNSKILIDGYFTRSSVWELYQSQTQPTMQPDLDDIDYAMQKLESDGLDALFTVHSHFDHAMDAPEVARRTGARLYGSLSTANIARGWD
ncbi:MAG: MBL fold metallo-hydrolase, partial [Bacteroidia bacterium]|nr:MBL fold metallo-hydrolase [Bacteroidia bacterium]